jgi:hypothetical protein
MTPGGSRKGVPNKFTVVMKEAFERAFEEIGGTDGLAAWARLNRTEFYRLCAKLIPLSVHVANTVKVLSYAERMSQDESATAAGTAETVPERTLQ